MSYSVLHGYCFAVEWASCQFRPMFCAKAYGSHFRILSCFRCSCGGVCYSRKEVLVRWTCFSSILGALNDAVVVCVVILSRLLSRGRRHGRLHRLTLVYRGFSCGLEEFTLARCRFLTLSCLNFGSSFLSHLMT